MNCGECGKVCSSQRGLNIHRGRKHPGVGQSEECNYDGTQSLQLQQYLRNQHHDQHNVATDECQVESVDDLNGVRCDICNKRFKLNGLPIHIAKVPKEQSNDKIASKYRKYRHCRAV